MLVLGWDVAVRQLCNYSAPSIDAGELNDSDITCDLQWRAISGGAKSASLFAQTCEDWTLLIRDDGSTDSTPEILKRLASGHPNKIRIIHDNTGKQNQNLGYAHNFGRLMGLSTAPYVMFCDQDDIWHPDKIALSLQEMKELEQRYGEQCPLLVRTDFALVDSKNNIILSSYQHGFGKKHLDGDLTPEE